MQKWKRSTALMAMLLIGSACSGGSAAPQPDGPAKLGVIAGNNQIVTAAPVVQNRLPQDVVAQVIRLPNGQVGLRTRVIDAMLPEKAYAQTGVTGIANQVVCATTPDPTHKLAAEVPCATSDATGKAYFVFHADTLAGVSKAQVAAALPTGTKVTDSVQATVVAGAVDPNFKSPNMENGHFFMPITKLPAVVPASSVRDAYGNAIPFRIVSDGLVTVQDTTTGSVGARTFTAGPPKGTPVSQPIAGIVDLRGAGGVLVGHGRYTFSPDRTELQGWTTAGVNGVP